MEPQGMQPETPQPAPHRNYKYLFFGLLTAVLLMVVGVGGYYLGARNSDSKKTNNIEVFPITTTEGPSPTEEPVAMVTPVDGEIVPMGENTVGYARSGKTTLLAYRGKVYKSSSDFYQEGEPISKYSNLTFKGLVETPKYVKAGEFMLDEMLSFMTDPDNNGFIFIMRWGADFQSTSYYVYHYNPSKEENKLELVGTFPQDSPTEQFSIPTVSAISENGRYAAFTLLACLNCGGSQGDTMLMDLTTKKKVLLGKTVYFSWRKGGEYEYKEYKIISCPPEYVVGERMQTPCYEDEKNMPMKTGKM